MLSALAGLILEGVGPVLFKTFVMESIAFILILVINLSCKESRA